MPLYAVEDGRVTPVTPQGSERVAWDGEVAADVRSGVLDLIEHALLPLAWRTDDALLGEYLVALDATGSAVVVLVRDQLEPEVLVAALGRSAWVRRASWREVATWYPEGPEKLRQDWTAFRESLPPRGEAAPGLMVAAGAIPDSVRGALEVLDPAAVTAHEVVPQLHGGQRVLQVEPVASYTLPRHVLLEVEGQVAQIDPVEIEASVTPNGRVSGDVFGESVEVPAPAASNGTPSQPLSRRARRRAAESQVPTPLPEASPPPVTDSPTASAEPRRRSRAHAAAEAEPTAVPEPTAEPETPRPTHVSVLEEADRAAKLLGIDPVTPEPPSAVAGQGDDAAAPEPTRRRRRSHRAPSSGPEPREALVAVVELVGEAELVLEGTQGSVRAALTAADLLTWQGRSFADPTEAATQALGQPVPDGWMAWRFGETGPFLGEALEEALRGSTHAPRPPRRRAVER